MPLDESLELMTENEIDCIIVRNKRGVIEGIFTSVDALEAVALLARPAASN